MKNFDAIDALLALVVLASLGVVGWAIMHSRRHKAADRAERYPNIAGSIRNDRHSSRTSMPMTSPTRLAPRSRPATRRADRDDDNESGYPIVFDDGIHDGPYGYGFHHVAPVDDRTPETSYTSEPTSPSYDPSPSSSPSSDTYSSGSSYDSGSSGSSSYDSGSSSSSYDSGSSNY